MAANRTVTLSFINGRNNSKISRMEENGRKQIVILNKRITDTVKIGKKYDCEIIPMKLAAGYIAIKAVEHVPPPKVDPIIKIRLEKVSVFPTFRVNVKKDGPLSDWLSFDPESDTNYQKKLAYLKSSNIENKDAVLEEYERLCREVLQEFSGYADRKFANNQKRILG
jgi:hypothetical protein